MARPVSEIQADLDVAYAARRKALEAEAYSQNSGQGSLSVTRSLQHINETIKQLESELDGAQADAAAGSSGGGGIFCPVFTRG